MTKEEFKKKYHGQVIAISYPITCSGGINVAMELSNKTNQLNNIAKEMGLKVTELPEMAHVGLPKKTFAVIDPNKPQTGYSGQPNITISVEELLEDFSHYVEKAEEIQSTKILDILASFKTNNVDIKYIGAQRNMKQLAEDGFIQGYTSNEASLWWNPNGRQLLFVRGEGVFELTDKTEEDD